MSSDASLLISVSSWRAFLNSFNLCPTCSFNLNYDLLGCISTLQRKSSTRHHYVSPSLAACGLLGETAYILPSLPRHVDDVDLFTGGVAESPVGGGLVGATFSCLMRKQFADLRNGDRFFYLNRDGPQKFTTCM